MTMPMWVEIVLAVLLVGSGVFALIAAFGVATLPTFFQRMHPPALAFTFSTWSVTLASIISASMREGKLVLHPWTIIILLSITVPVTTLLLSRAALFRRRDAGDAGIPPPLSVREQTGPSAPESGRSQVVS